MLKNKIIRQGNVHRTLPRKTSSHSMLPSRDRRNSNGASEVKNYSRNTKPPESSFTEDSDLSPLSSEEAIPLPATLVNCGASRRVGEFSLTSYEYTDEEEELDSDSSLENSGEYEPLGFTVLMGGPSKFLHKPKANSYRVIESVDSNDELSFSEAPLVVDFERLPKRRASQVPREANIEINESESEVEIMEEDEIPLNAVVIDKLVRRLNNPNAQVVSREFEELDWDDSNFEEELRTLRQIASYTEVKETIMKTAKDRAMKSSAVIDKKIKDAVMTLPDITVVKVKNRSVGPGVNSGAAPKSGKESTQSTNAVSILKGPKGEKIIMLPNKVKITVTSSKEAHMNSRPAGKKKMTESMILGAEKGQAAMAFSKEAHMNSRPAGKKKMTESMILAAAHDQAAMTPSKESRMGSHNVEKQKRVAHLLASQSHIETPKEAVFGEDEKPRRKKRNNTSCCVSVLMDEVPDVVTEEIVETEYMEEKLNVGYTKVGELKEDQHEEDKAPRQARKRHEHRKGRSSFLFFDVMPDELPTDQVVEENTALSSKKKKCTTRRRHQRYNGNRSISFVDVVEDEEVHELVEENEAQSVCVKPQRKDPKQPFGGDKVRHRRTRKNTSRGSLSFSGVPEEVVECIVEENQTTNVPLDTARIPRKPPGREMKKEGDLPRRQISDAGDVRSPRAKKEDNRSEKRKEKKRRVLENQRSRELEFSFIPDEGPNEIFERDADIELGNGKGGAAAYARVPSTGQMKGVWNDRRDSNMRRLPALDSGTQLKSRARPDKRLNATLSITELPDIMASEIPGIIVDSRTASRLSNRINPEVNVDKKKGKARRTRASNPNRSCSFMEVLDNDAKEVQENAEENINIPAQRGKPAVARASSTPRTRDRARRRNSAVCSMSSINVSHASTMEDNLDQTLNNTARRQKKQ